MGGSQSTWREYMGRTCKLHTEKPQPGVERWRNMLQLIRLGIKKEHLGETEPLRSKDGQRFSNLPNTVLQIVEQLQNSVPRCKMAKNLEYPIIYSKQYHQKILRIWRHLCVRRTQLKVWALRQQRIKNIHLWWKSLRGLRNTSRNQCL